jgi:hypothetical protein
MPIRDVNFHGKLFIKTVQMRHTILESYIDHLLGIHTAEGILTTVNVRLRLAAMPANRQSVASAFKRDPR